MQKMWHSVKVRQQNDREFIADKACWLKLFNTFQCPGSAYNQIVRYASKHIPVKVKHTVMEKCVSFCCKDIEPFDAVKGEGFEELAQELINVKAAYGKVPVNSVIPHHVTIAKRCTDVAEEGRYSTET